MQTCSFQQGEAEWLGSRSRQPTICLTYIHSIRCVGVFFASRQLHVQSTHYKAIGTTSRLLEWFSQPSTFPILHLGSEGGCTPTCSNLLSRLYCHSTVPRILHSDSKVVLIGTAATDGGTRRRATSESKCIERGRQKNPNDEEIQFEKTT